MEMSMERKWQLAAQSLGMFVHHLMVPLKKRFGDRFLDVLRDHFDELGKVMAPIMKNVLNLQKCDADDLAKIIDWQDTLIGVKGEWVERTPTKATKHVTYCPILRDLMDCPEFCVDIMAAWIASMYRVLNPKVKMSFDKLLAWGDDICSGTVEIED